MTRRPDSPLLRLRLHFGGTAMLGPGKADLLEAIGATGSIAAAARRMGMSYRRAWSLVEALNAMFDLPLVDTARGGAGKGGAVLTLRGRAVLALFRQAEAAARAGAAGPMDQLQVWAAAERTVPPGEAGH